MNTLFGNLSSEGLEEAQDRVGGFGVLDSAIYDGVVKAFYAGKSAGGARSVSIILDVKGREYRETFYVTNKKGENFFLNKDDKTKKVPLPGFTVVDDICLVTTGKPLSEQDSEDKVIKLWDNDLKKEVPTTVPMLTEVIGQPLALGIIKQLVNKNAKNAAGEYEATAETREENFTDKVFEPSSRMTVVEAKAESTEAKFHEGWAERNNGKVRDKRTIKDGEGGTAGAPPKGKSAGSAPAAGGAPARKSLFGNK